MHCEKALFAPLQFRLSVCPFCQLFFHFSLFSVRNQTLHADSFHIPGVQNMNPILGKDVLDLPQSGIFSPDVQFNPSVSGNNSTCKKSLFCCSGGDPDKPAGSKKRSSKLTGHDNHGVMDVLSCQYIENRLPGGSSRLSIITETLQFKPLSQNIGIAVVRSIVMLFPDALYKFQCLFLRVNMGNRRQKTRSLFNNLRFPVFKHCPVFFDHVRSSCIFFSTITGISTFSKLFLKFLSANTEDCIFFFISILKFAIMVWYKRRHMLMNYGRKKAAKKRKDITSKSKLKKKRLGVRIFKGALLTLLLLVVAGCVGGGIFIKKVINDAPDVTPEDVKPTGYTSVIYASDNKTETERLTSAGSNRVYKTIDEIPKDLQHAFVAIEDER